MIEAPKQVEVGRHYRVAKEYDRAWKANYTGVDVSEAQEMRQLRDEDARLKKLLADQKLIC